MNNFSSFYLKKWHSIMGMIPVGFFLIMHIYTQSFSAMGENAYNQRFTTTISNPWLLGLEIIFLYIPLLFHGIFGMLLIFSTKYNITKYPNYLDNWRHLLQRISGFGVFFFIIAHFTMTRGHSWFAKEGWTKGNPIEGWYQHMSLNMKHNLTFMVYFLGVLGACYHFSNGIWTFFNSMGISKGVKAQKTMKIISIIVTVILIFVAFIPLYYFRFKAK